MFSVFSVVAEVASREPSVNDALREALSAVCGQLQTNASRLTDLPRDTGRLRAFVVVSACPALEDPVFHDSVVAKLCKAFGALRKRCQDVLSHWFATIGGGDDMLVRLDDPLALILEVRVVVARGQRGRPDPTLSSPPGRPRVWLWHRGDRRRVAQPQSRARAPCVTE